MANVQYVPPVPEPAPIVPPKKETKKAVAKETVIETLNAPKPSTSAAPPPATATTEDDDEDETLPELTPSLREFSKLGLQEYEKSWKFIQAHRDVFVPGATDALLVEAFAAERRGERKYAKQCVHQGLLLQYCEKLGVDGPSLFFKR